MRLIDADALMHSLGITDMDCGMCDLHGAMGCSKKGDFVDACVAIEHAPTIEERKKGKWLPIGQDHEGGYDWMNCSVCGYREINVPTARTNYCPNCGADMRGLNDEVN